MDWINQNRLTKLLIVVLLAVNILTVSIIWMQNMQKKELLPSEAVPPRQTVELMQNTIDLTDDQTERFAIMREEHFAKRRIVETKIASLNRQIFEEMFGGKKDTVKINGLYSQIAVKLTEIEKLRIGHFARLASICNEEQKEKLKRLLMSTVDSPGPMERRGNPPPPPLHERDGIPPLER